VRGWPTVYVIDQNGVIREKTLGFQEAKINEAIQSLLDAIDK
jgi:hypothetical protein